jgi:hypothetical protein
VIQRFLVKRLGMAEHQVLVTAGGQALGGFLEGGIDRALREAQERGVKVRVVTEVFPSTLSAAKHFSTFTELRHANGPVMSRSVVIDRNGSLVYVSGEDGAGPIRTDQVALWSSAPMFTQLARDYHRRLWTPAERADARFVELENPPTAVLPVVTGREGVPFTRLKEIAKLGMRASGVKQFHLQLPTLIETIARELGQEIAKEVDGATPAEVGAALAQYYETHTMGHLTVLKDRPLTLRVTGCFACTEDSPEIGRVMCPMLLRSILETRLGQRWEVSKPDPTRHAQRGCTFTASAA